jgi:hypothetical protein
MDSSIDLDALHTHTLYREYTWGCLPFFFGNHASIPLFLFFGVGNGASARRDFWEGREKVCVVKEKEESEN